MLPSQYQLYTGIIIIGGNRLKWLSKSIHGHIRVPCSTWPNVFTYPSCSISISVFTWQPATYKWWHWCLGVCIGKLLVLCPCLWSNKPSSWTQCMTELTIWVWMSFYYLIARAISGWAFEAQTFTKVFQPLKNSNIQAFKHSFIHSFVHSLIQSFIPASKKSSLAFYWQEIEVSVTCLPTEWCQFDEFLDEMFMDVAGSPATSSSILYYLLLLDYTTIVWNALILCSVFMCDPWESSRELLT